MVKKMMLQCFFMIFAFAPDNEMHKLVPTSEIPSRNTLIVHHTEPNNIKAKLLSALEERVRENEARTQKIIFDWQLIQALILARREEKRREVKIMESQHLTKKIGSL